MDRASQSRASRRGLTCLAVHADLTRSPLLGLLFQGASEPCQSGESYRLRMIQLYTARVDAAPHPLALCTRSSPNLCFGLRLPGASAPHQPRENYRLRLCSGLVFLDNFGRTRTQLRISIWKTRILMVTVPMSFTLLSFLQLSEGSAGRNAERTADGART